MNFSKSLEYLYGLGNEVTTMKLGLENISKLLAALGNPQNNFTKVQVAGTNGKGSTCAFLDAIGVSAGIKTGLYTSPHLVSITERIKIGGREISEKKFAEHATEIKKISEKLVEAGDLEYNPTFFEQLTAIALNFFAESKIELAILETGLGGRFDATTAAKAEIVAIAPIDYDHQDILGETLTEIAAEKAAIIRVDTKVVLAKQSDEAQNVVRAVCDFFGIVPHATDFKAEILGVDEAGKYIVNFSSETRKYKNVHLNLLGKHQIENAKAAILLAEILQNNNFKISGKNVKEGLQTAAHKGRLEFYKGILFDGAHNAAGAKSLKVYLDEFIRQPVTMIFGAMRDKDSAKIAKILFPKAAKLILTEPNNARSSETEDLMKFVPVDFEKKNVHQVKSVEKALKKALEISTDESLICVTGSLYLVGEARRALKTNLK